MSVARLVATVVTHEPTGTADGGERDGGDGAPADGDADGEDRVRLWFVERTYSDDEQNIVILVYATPDGSRYLRKERALTSFDDDRETMAVVDARPSSVGAVDDPDLRERYAAEVARTRERYDADDSI